MDTFSAFAMGAANRHREMMVFDWDKAAKLILEFGASEASAGLSGDWEYTGGSIFREGKPTPSEDTYTYLASTWAEPQIEIDGEMIDCFRMASECPGWNADTYWPESAKAILSNLK